MIASVITLGCKVNEYESQSILNQLKSACYDICEGLVFADVYVVNTCAVTNVAEKKSRQILAKIEKLNITKIHFLYDSDNFVQEILI